MSATIVLTIVSIISPMVSGVCEMCTPGNNDCYDLAGNLPADDGVATCQAFGGDNICYFSHEDNPSGGGLYEDYRICTTDRQCAQRFDSGTYNCLRCCPNAANDPNSLCTQTASSGRETCGVINEYIGRMNNNPSPMDWYFPDAPCCDGDECLDGIAGVCGEPVNDECGRCTMWSYLIGEEAGGAVWDLPHYYSDSFADLPLGYTTGDDCGTGMVCVKDSRSDNIPYKPEAELEPRRGLQEELESRRRLSSPFIFNFGFCVPENGVSDISDVCSNDNQCPSCMRCCNGQCMRATGEYECGLEGRGPCCCSTDVCKFNECLTPTKNPTQNPTNPTKNPSKHDDSGDNNDQVFVDSSDDQVFGAEFGGVNENDRVVDNDVKRVEYTVSLNGGNLNNLFIFGALLILLICGCIVAYYWCGKNNTKVQSFQNDIDQISNI